jgi:hypothetical protein
MMVRGLHEVLRATLLLLLSDPRREGGSCGIRHTCWPILLLLHMKRMTVAGGAAAAQGVERAAAGQR